jgi:integrase
LRIPIGERINSGERGWVSLGERRRVVRIFGKDSPIGDVTYKSVHAYIEQRSQETTCQCSSAKPPRTCTNECPRVSRHTIAKELCVLRGILAEARMDHEFAESIDLVVPAYATAYKPVETFLSIAQVHRLADALPEERGAFVCFIASTGARLSEALAAVGADVDLTSWRVRLHGTKTVGSDRTVAIDELWRPTLARALEQARQGDGPLFDRWPMLHRSLRAACRRAGIPGVSPNDLRRSFASVLVQDGVDPTLVGRLLGHTSSAMVEKVYGRRTVDSDAVLLARRHGVRTAAEPPTPAPAAPASRPAATPAPATVYPVGTRPWIPVGSTRPGGLLN